MKIKCLTSCSYEGTWRFSEEDRSIDDEAKRLVEDGWVFLHRNSFNSGFSTVVREGSDVRFVHAGRCMYYDDTYVVALVWGNTVRWEVEFDNLEWTVARIAAGEATLDQVAYLVKMDANGELTLRRWDEVVAEAEKALGPLPWVRAVRPFVSRLTKPAREAARLRRREAARKAAEEAANRAAANRAARAVDARLGDLTEWENFVRPYRWTF